MLPHKIARLLGQSNAEQGRKALQKCGWNEGLAEEMRRARIDRGFPCRFVVKGGQDEDWNVGIAG